MTFEDQNRAAAERILVDPAAFGGEQAALVIWARATARQPASTPARRPSPQGELFAEPLGTSAAAVLARLAEQRKPRPVSERTFIGQRTAWPKMRPA